jgi:predicted GIY-YIG superfamily endonuclease
MVYPSVDNAEEGDVYIGSTTQSLAKRMMSHRSYHKKVITSAVLLYLRNMV